MFPAPLFYNKCIISISESYKFLYSKQYTVQSLRVIDGDLALQITRRNLKIKFIEHQVSIWD